MDRSSYDQLFSFVELIEQISDGKQFVPPIIFLGNKKDLIDRDPQSRVISQEDINKLIRTSQLAVDKARVKQHNGENITWQIQHYETSALSGERIDEIFEGMVREIRKRRQPAVTKKKSWCWLL